MNTTSRSLLIRYGVALVTVTAALALSLLMRPVFQHSPLILFYVAIAFSAWFGRLAPALFATLLSVLAVNYFFGEPLYAFHANVNDAIRSFIFALVAIVLSIFFERSKRTEDELRRS